MLRMDPGWRLRSEVEVEGVVDSGYADEAYTDLEKHKIK